MHSLAPRGAFAAAGVAAAVAAWTARPVMPPLLPIGDYAVYDAAAARILALVEPVAHAPWFGAAPAPWGAAFAAAIIAALWLVACRAGGAPAAAVVCAAVLSRIELRVPLALGAEPAIGLGLTWASTLLLTGGGHAGRVTAWGAALAAAAVACWPPLAVVMPALAVVAIGRGRWAGAAVLGAAVVGAAGGVALWAARAAALSNEAVSVLDVIAAVVADNPRGGDPFVWPRLTSAALPAVLAVLGGWSLASRVPSGRRALLAVAVLCPVVAALSAPAWRDEIARATLWTAWPLAAAGVAWLAAAAPRRSWLVTTAAGVVLVAGGLSASIRVVADDDRRAFGRALSDALSPVVGEASTFVAEDTRIDTAVVAWGASAGVQRVRPIPRLVEAAMSGRTVLAGPSARTALELWGFRFTPRAGVETPARFAVAAISGRLRCLPVAAPWRELPGLEYTGRLGLHLPAGSGQLEVTIVGPPPLTPRLTWADGRPVGRIVPLAMDLPSLPPVLWPGDGRLPDATQIGLRLELPALGDLTQSATLALGQRAPLVAVRFTEPAHLTGVATVCAAPLPRDAADVAAAVPLDDDAYFAGGWHPVERASAAWFRWTAGRAVTLLPSDGAAAVAIAVTARAAAPGPVTLTAVVNGTSLEAQAMGPGDREYRWPVPAGLWVEGTNELVLDVSATTRPSAAGSADTRELGVAVTALRILRD